MDERTIGMIIVFAAAALAFNVLSFFLMKVDKARASNGRPRVSEGRFFSMALFGAWPGIVLGMLTFRHKTRKASFKVVVAVASVVNVALVTLAVLAP